MDVKELTHPSETEFTRLADILSDSFWRTPLFREYLFRGRKPLARTFIEALLIYTQKTGRTFVAVDGDKGIVACSLWSLPDSPELDMKTYLATGMWPKMLSIALRSPAAMARIAELFRFLEIYAPEFPCNTLEFLASAEKGAGAVLVQGSIPYFTGYPLYVESIVFKNDHAFYRQFGFEPFERADFHGTDYAFALIRDKCDANEPSL